MLQPIFPIKAHLYAVSSYAVVREYRITETDLLLEICICATEPELRTVTVTLSKETGYIWLYKVNCKHTKFQQ